MPAFKAFIYGNVPVEVQIDRDGNIEEMAVLNKNYETANDVLYWLELSPEDTDRFEADFVDKINDCLVEYERGKGRGKPLRY